MMNRLMVSVATVALIAGCGFANAQGAGPAKESGGTEMHSAPAAGGAAPSAPTGGATMEKRGSAAPAAAPEMKSSQSEQKSPAGAKNQRAEDNAQGQKSKSMSSETETKGAPKDMKAEGREGANSTTKAEGANSNTKAEGRNGNMNAETKSTTERSQTTTGQAGAGAKLSTEQRTKISTVIRSQNVSPVTNVNFSISVGTRVPRDIEYRPLPTEVVTIYPEWRGYDFVLVRDQIVVIDPNTFEIVAVLDT